MTSLVYVGESGPMQIGPNDRRRMYREGQQVEWEWPLLAKGDPNYNPATAVPKRWRVLVENLSDAELAQRLDHAKPLPHDPRAARAKDTMRKDRGFNEQDQKWVREAVESLVDGEGGHWTTRGQPKVDIVQMLVENYMKEDGHENPSWPKWCNRGVIENASKRVRDESFREAG